MTDQAWLAYSLRRSASLGLDVLKRASRRTVDWTSAAASLTPTTTEEDVRTSVERLPSELNDAFESITYFMAQTSYQCKRYYESGLCSSPTHAEMVHRCRFHTRPGAGNEPAPLPSRKHRAGEPDEEFHIEVFPGTYAITACSKDSPPQTRLVSVMAGESVLLTYDL